MENKKFLDLEGLGYYDSKIQDKLDEKADTSSLSNYYTKSQTNANIAAEAAARQSADANLQTQINGLASGSPLAASSVAEMIDTSKIYVNTTDGYWYYYDGDSWEQGGVYQSTGLADASVTLPKISGSVFGTSYHFDGTTSSIGTGVTFSIPDNLFKASDISSVKAVFSIKNESATNGTGVLYFHVGRKGVWGTDIQLQRWFVSYTDHTKWYDENLSKTGVSIANNYYINEIRLYYYNAPGDYDFTIKDIKLYINDQLLDLTFDSTSTQNSLVVAKDEDITYIAKKDYIESVAADLYDRMDEIEAELPSDSDLTIAKAYDSVSKSNLYEIACWGDSLTAGPYPTDLGTLIGNTNVTVHNFGQSGESSGTIAFRQGANVIKTAEDITIPASNAESVEFTYTVSTGFIQNIARINLPATIDGIEGTIEYQWAPNSWKLSFTRTESGSTKSVPSGTKIVYADADKNLDNVSIVWLGRNDIAFSSPHIQDGIMSNYQGMVNALTPTVKRFIVLGTINGSSEVSGTANYNIIKSINEELASLYPHNYYDVRSYLVNECIYDLGIVPTAADITAMDGDAIPPSITIDNLHLTSEAYEAMAIKVYEFMLSKGWIIK